MYLVKVIVHSVLHARSGKCGELLHLERWPYMEIIIAAEVKRKKCVEARKCHLE